MADHSYNIDFSNINYSLENYDSTNAPFFRSAPSNELNNLQNTSIIDCNNMDIINEFKLLGLEQNINDFFINHQAFNKEIYINNITLLSINKILEINEEYKKDNILNIIDIGFKYSGMGWISVIYYNTKFNKLFVRMDGGSNGFDRIQNYNIMKKMSKIDKIELIDTNVYSFDEILNL